jgi:hypothetical protein
MLGMALFTIGSRASRLSGGAAGLIAFRALQGFGGAIVSPATLAIINDAFAADGAERNKEGLPNCPAPPSSGVRGRPVAATCLSEMRLGGFEPPTHGLEGRRSSAELQALTWRVAPARAGVT